MNTIGGTRRGFLKAVGFGAAALLAPASVSGAGRKAKRPNIVLIMADDMGYSDLGCYGGEIETPRLNQMARDGLRFSQFYNCAKCSPTRNSLLTGLYHQRTDIGQGKNCVTIAEALKQTGYTTLMTGKWHVGSTPMDRGFERYFGMLSGSCSFFVPNNSFRIDTEPFRTKDKNFYTTNAFTDYALDFLDDTGKKDKPFFLYVAYNAPHYPLQAPKEDVERYRGKYLAGWDALRQKRYEHQLKLGIIKPEWKLSPWPKNVRVWDSLSEKQKDAEDFTMATYAAMVDRLDQNIGRLLAKLDALGVAENTLVMFMADNGGCPFDRTRGRQFPPWDPKSYWCYHEAWAGLSNTPFRWYKQNNHEGGIASPMIVRWPKVITQGGAKTHQHGHLIDIMATAIDIADVEYPASYNGQKIKPLRGRSLVPIFQGKQREPHEAIFWQFSNNRAVRRGKWKLTSARGGPWELYDMQADRKELNDLAKRDPKRADAMAKQWTKWARATGLEKRGKRSKKKRDTNSETSTRNTKREK